jgi:hypothetical protein
VYRIAQLQCCGGNAAQHRDKSVNDRAVTGFVMARRDACRFVAGLWLTTSGAALEAALRGWAVVLCCVDVRTLGVPLIEATLEHLAAHLAVRRPPQRRPACCMVPYDAEKVWRLHAPHVPATSKH